MSDQAETAYRLGSQHRYMERAPLDVADSGSAELMDALGETGPTSEANYPERLAMCDAYLDGYHDASRALGDAPSESGIVRDASGAILRGPCLPCGCPLDSGCDSRHG